MGHSEHIHNIGSRAEVFHGNARKTSGGLTKKDLIRTSRGRIVSAKKHAHAKKHNNLLKHGYGYRPGVFGPLKKINQKGETTEIIKTKNTLRGGAPLQGALLNSNNINDEDNWDPNAIDNENAIKTAPTLGGGKRKHKRTRRTMKNKRH